MTFLTQHRLPCVDVLLPSYYSLLLLQPRVFMTRRYTNPRLSYLTVPLNTSLLFSKSVPGAWRGALNLPVGTQLSEKIEVD